MRPDSTASGCPTAGRPGTGRLQRRWSAGRPAGWPASPGSRSSLAMRAGSPSGCTPTGPRSPAGCSTPRPRSCPS